MTSTATVLGASGYSGGELLRLLARHPEFEVIAVGGNRSAGESLGFVHPHLAGSSAIVSTLEEAAAAPADVCFSCLPGGHLSKYLDDLRAPLVVDFADDFRGDPEWTYGLTEFARAEVAASGRIANPGCYPTATLLALLPFARSDLVEGPVVVDAISGASGAGRKVADHLLIAGAGASVGAYGTISHRHVPEIERGLALFGDLETTVSFTPHLAPMSRGLLSTVRARLRDPLGDSGAVGVLREAYENEPFVQVLEDWPSTKATSGSNAAHVAARVDRRTGWLICSGAIDNLGKGAAGQALQNANLALDLPEGLGLEATGTWP
jgi:N-acetyl-gamma-glutamyl-phosphate reductase